LENEFKGIVGVFNEAWHENWGFTPLSFEEAAADFRKVKIFAKQDLLMIAEYKGEPVGFTIALPDINQVLRPFKGRMLPLNWLRLLLGLKRITQIRVLLMGVLKSFRNKGIDLMFYKKIVDNSLRHGYSRAELSWILENNAMMNRVLQHINAKKNKVYVVFEKSLE
jgi:GNAT superfamily N-acetyltransferase